MDEQLIKEIEELEAPFLNESFNSQNAFIIEAGTIPVVVSAPHSVPQWRLEAVKQGEFRTGSLARFLHRDTFCHCVYKTRNMHDDANFDDKNEYKDALVQYVKDNNIKYLIDLHIMSQLRPHSVDLGTGHGLNIANDYSKIRAMLCIFNECNISDVLIDKIFSAANPNTVSATVARECGIYCVQFELNWRIVDFTNMETSLSSVIQALKAIILMLANEEMK